MIETVGNDEVLGMQLKVVCCDLIEDFLGDLNMWSFKLDDHPWLEHAVVEYAVGPEVFGTDTKWNFIGE